jgi:septal ring factor EnvC (AmiA/AmiB activator)
MQWGREADLRAELRAVRIAERDLRTKSAEAIRLGETYASEIRRLDARVGDLKRSEEALRKELSTARAAEQAARQAVAELGPLRTSLAKQNESIRHQNETVTKQNAAIRTQNESLRKLVAERDEVVRLLNERTELLNKLNAERSAK